MCRISWSVSHQSQLSNRGKHCVFTHRTALRDNVVPKAESDEADRGHRDLLCSGKTLEGPTANLTVWFGASNSACKACMASHPKSARTQTDTANVQIPSEYRRLFSHEDASALITTTGRSGERACVCPTHFLASCRRINGMRTERRPGFKA